MPYYSGSANNLSDLRTALFDACVANGWALSGGVLTKAALAVEVVVNETSSASAGYGLLLQGGTSASGSALVNPSPNKGRLGPVQTSTDQIAWPVTYEVFLRENPDEVFLIINTNIDMYMWLAFGGSSVPGIGVWGGGNSKCAAGPTTNGVNINISSGTISGGSTNSTVPQSSCGLFANTTMGTLANSVRNADFIHTNIDGVVWAGNPSSNVPKAVGQFDAIYPARTLLYVQPNAWNNEGVLLRIRPYLWRAGGKSSAVVDVQNARYTRINNYTPGQVITLGTEHWKVYPFYRKNLLIPDGVSGGNHSGTFGWAIKYDGPM